MIYLLYGEDEFLVQEEVARLRAGMGPADMLDLNSARLDGLSVSFPEFEAAVCTIPFMADCRLVLVNGLLARFQRRGAALASEDGEDEPEPVPETPRGRRAANADAAWDQLGDLLGRLPETTQLLLVDGEVNARNRMLKVVSAAAQVKTFHRLRGAQLSDWVKARAQSHGCKLNAEGLRLLLGLAGDNLRLLDSELQKLAMYANGEPVGEETVRKLVPLAAETTIFGLVDAFAERQLTQAQRELHRMLGDGAAPIYILFMLARQMRLVLQARDLLAEKLPQQEMMRQLGIFSEFPFKKTVDQARRADTRVLVQTMTRLLEADVQMKTGVFDPVVSLELLVTDLCGAPAAGRR